MLKAGGTKQQARDKVMKIFGEINFGSKHFGKLTKNGEKRIKHCIKYDLPGKCRLVTVQKNNFIILLFVGDHAECDHWIKQNEGFEFVVDKKTNKISILSGKKDYLGVGLSDATFEKESSVLGIMDIPELEEWIPQKKLRKELLGLSQFSSNEDVEEVLELIQDKEIYDLFWEIFYHLREGEKDEAQARLDRHRGDAVDALEDTELLGKAVDSPVNAENIVDFGKMTMAEIELLLDPKRFDDWMLFLHPDQRKIVEAKYSKPAILRGVSGSGKTVIVIHRAKELANRYPGENIGIITLNRDLAKLLENLVRKLCVNGEHERIKVQAYYDYFKEVINHFGAEKYIDEMIDITPPENRHLLNILTNAKRSPCSIINETCEKSGETLEDTWQEFWNDEIEKSDYHSKTKRILIRDLEGGFDVESYVRDEFDLIRSAFALKYRDSKGEDGYMEYARRGREVPFVLGVREHVLALLAKYEEYMLAGSMMDPLGLGQTVYPILPKLKKLPEHLLRRCLLVDEFQDFSTLELQFFERVPTSVEDGLFLAGDLVQKVLVKDFDLPKAYLGRGDVRKEDIRKNYRNSRQILEAANELAQKYSKLAAKSDTEFEILNPEFAVRQTAMPIALKCKDPIEQAWLQVSNWLEGSQIDPCSVCLVSANVNSYPLRKIQNSCPSHLQAKKLNGDYMQRKESVNFSTLSEVKGFEFGMIVVIGACEDSIPDSTYPMEEQWREALRLYVAMTRGRDQVLFTYRDKPSEFLLSMKEFITWNDAADDKAPEEMVPLASCRMTG